MILFQSDYNIILTRGGSNPVPCTNFKLIFASNKKKIWDFLLKLFQTGILWFII